MEYEDLIEFYSNKMPREDDFCLIEIKMLTGLMKSNEWKKLTSVEKQISRENKIHWLITKVYYETKLPNFVLFELSVTEFYKESILLIKEIEHKLNDILYNKNNTVEEFLLIRLYSVLSYTIDLVNSHYEIKQIGHFPLEIIENVISKSLISFRNYDLNELNLKFLKMKALYNSKPYLSK